jgi:hypothetical protein
VDYLFSFFSADYRNFFRDIFVEFAFAFKFYVIVRIVVDAHSIFFAGRNASHLVKKCRVPEVVKIETSNVIAPIGSSVGVQSENGCQLALQNAVLTKTKMILEFMSYAVSFTVKHEITCAFR